MSKTIKELHRLIVLKLQLVELTQKEILALEAQIRDIERKGKVAGNGKT